MSRNEKNFEKVLSDKRIPIDTPNDLVDENGKAVFGTFNKEFPQMNFLNIKNQSILPDFTNPFRLTLWEAAEVNFDDVILLTAVCNMGIGGTALTVLYDKKEEKCYKWQEILTPNAAKVSPTLLNNDVTKSTGFINRITYKNDFGNDKASLKGKAIGTSGKIKYKVELKRVSLPSIVSIPFAKNKPLYSQKDLFEVKGYLEFNGKKYTANKNSTAIIDDHRGYYPYNSHYDWVTTMGRCNIDGKNQYFGINLTRNQSINQDDYNENLIWLEENTQRLTPVKFKHEDKNKWHIVDEHGMVDVVFDIGDEVVMKVNVIVAKMDYHITFGKVSGYVLGEDGKKYVIDDMIGIGEDKSLRV